MGETIREAYIRKNPRSAELYPKFEAVFPTGVSHDMRMADLPYLHCPRPGGAQVGCGRQ
jgi:hypothetical protein